MQQRSFFNGSFYFRYSHGDSSTYFRSFPGFYVEEVDGEYTAGLKVGSLSSPFILGTFNTLEEAEEAMSAATHEYHHTRVLPSLHSGYGPFRSFIGDTSCVSIGVAKSGKSHEELVALGMKDFTK